MTNTWLVLLPTIIVIISAFTIKKLNISLILGILSAALLATDFSIIKIFPLIFNRFLTKIMDPDQLLVLAFILIIGILIALLSITGGASAFARILKNKVKNAKAAETSSILVSFALFIDDYLSNLKVGYIMRPITDKFKVPRVKLAFLVHSMAGALVILTPFSNWGAFISGQLDASGISNEAGTSTLISADPFFTYIKSIPFIFYSFLIVASVIFIVRKRISFGPMAKHEQEAQKTGNLFGGRTDVKTSVLETGKNQNSLADLIVPLVTLISLVITGLTYALLTTSKSILSNSFFMVTAAGVITLLISFIFALSRNKIKITKIPSVFATGIKIMYEPIVMLILAMILGQILEKDLNTGGYLAKVLIGSLSIKFLPVMLFIAAAISGIATGTSWGTIMLLTPIAIPMITDFSLVDLPTTLDKIAIILPSLGAIFSGAICGDHISPISETTIMASMSSGSNPVDHAFTQMPYALPAIIGCLAGFLISGFLINYSFLASSLGATAVGLIITLGLLALFNKKKKINQKANIPS